MSLLTDLSRDAEKFRKLCDVTADLSDQCTRQSKMLVDGVELWVLRFSIELTLGSTEIEARIKWNHNVRDKCRTSLCTNLIMSMLAGRNEIVSQRLTLARWFQFIY